MATALQCTVALVRIVAPSACGWPPTDQTGRVLADRTYMSKANRAYLCRHGIKATILSKIDRDAHRWPIRFDGPNTHRRTGLREAAGGRHGRRARPFSPSGPGPGRGDLRAGGAVVSQGLRFEVTDRVAGSHV